MMGERLYNQSKRTRTGESAEFDRGETGKGNWRRIANEGKRKDWQRARMWEGT
jgi:hypothetical protein